MLRPDRRIAKNACPIHQRRFTNVDGMSIAQLRDIIEMLIQTCTTYKIIHEHGGVKRLDKVRREVARYLRIVKVLEWAIEDRKVL